MESLRKTSKYLMFSSSRVLGYHSVHPDRTDALAVHPNSFRMQMEWLSNLGWRGVSLEQVGKAIFESENSCGKVFGITFDDGYADNLRYALPILREFGFSATVFLISDTIGTDEVHNPRWLIDNPNVDASHYRYLRRDEVKELMDAGFEIGSHSVTHPFLDRLNRLEQLHEISDSKIAIERLTNSIVTSFCYPDGRYNDQTMNILMDSEYRRAVVTPWKTKPGSISSPFEIRRIGIYRTDNLLRFKLKCTPLFDLFRSLRSLN